MRKQDFHSEERRPHPPLPPRDKVRPGMLINDVSRLIHDEMRNRERELGIKSGYRLLLFHLNKEDGVSQYQLTVKTHLKAPTVSLTLQNMERDGLVERRANRDDLRQTLVYLTPAGRELDQQFRESIDAVDGQISAAVTPEEQEVLMEILYKIRRSFIDE